MSDVFVSYKAEDRRRVQPLVQALQSDGLSVWWDEHIGTGDEWRQTIEQQLDSARCVIVIWSKSSIGPEGHFVRDEASRAQRRHVYVPVLIDAVSPPLGFGESQATSLRGWRGSRSDPRYRAVLSAVLRITGVEPTSAAPHSVVGAPITRRVAIAGGAVAVAGIAAVGAWTLFKPSPAGASSNSVAVLPFENLSGDPAQAYFSDGIAEEIRSALVRIAGLKVVGRTSSEAVRSDDAATAATKLGVANILTGSVRQSPSTIRVNAELIDGHTGIDRWSQDYDRSPGDAIKIQTDIAQNVASALSAALGRVARATVSIGGTQNPEAQRLFIQAGAIAKSSTSKTQDQKALDLLDAAISLDPRYADAYASKSRVLGGYGNNYANAEELPKNRAEALRLAKVALAIAPDLPAGHRALFSVYSYEQQIGPAYSELKRARELAPGDADILTDLAEIASALGDAKTGLRLADEAISLDPLNPEPFYGHLNALFHARRYPEVLSYGRKVQSKFQDKRAGAMTFGDCLLLLGRAEEAQAYYALAAPDFWHRLTGEAILRIRSGDVSGAQQKLAQLRALYGDAASTQIGEIYAQMGDKNRAFSALDRAYQIKDAGLLGLKVDPFLDPLRSDPRFAVLLKQMNFPAA